MKSVLLCVATERGYEVLDAACACRQQTQIFVCTHAERHVAQSYEERIVELAARRGAERVAWRDFRKDPVACLRSRAIEGVLCAGWRYLIPQGALEQVGGNVVVAHDSLLPRLRGFVPLATALMAGETETGVTFMRAADAVDAGEILWQQAMPILPRDTISDLIRRSIPLYRQGTEKFLRGELKEGRPQNPSLATYSIWRDEVDYWIDWNASSEVIERTVRALGPPYLGARCRLGDKTVVVHEAEVLADLDFAIRQPGKVWALDEQGRPTVVCGRGLVRIVSATVDGQSLLPMKSLRVRLC